MCTIHHYSLAVLAVIDANDGILTSLVLIAVTPEIPIPTKFIYFRLKLSVAWKTRFPFLDLLTELAFVPIYRIMHEQSTNHISLIKQA